MYSVENEFDVQFSEDEFVGFEDIRGLKQIVLDKVRSRPAP
jgi:acyl carrier protein